jgi:hypothetical protein
MKATKKFYLTPKRTFITDRYLFPPYEIKKTIDYYELVKYTYYETKTTFLGWKIKLYFVRWYAWSL